MEKRNKFLTSKPFLMLVILAMAAFLLAAVFMHAYIGSFSRYLADDFCTSGKLKELGFWAAQSFWYTSWSGRFSFTFLVSLLESFGTSIVPLLPALYCGLLFISVYFFTDRIAHKLEIKLNLILKFFLASLFSFVLLYTIPAIGQDLYWMTGSATYLAPIIFGFVLMGVLVSTPAKNANILTKILYGALIVLLAIINSGFSEVSTVLQVVLLTFVIFAKRFRLENKKWDAWWILALLISLIGMTTMILASGNAVRQRGLSDNPGIITLVIKSAQYALTYIILWFAKKVHIVWASFTITSIISAWFIRTTKFRQLNQKRLQNSLIITLIALFLLVYVSFVPSTWATSNGPEDRVLIFPSVFLTLILIVSAIIVGYFLSKAMLQPLPQPFFFTITALILAAYFILAVPIYQARGVYEQKPDAANFAAAWDEREIIIQSQIASGQNEILVPIIENNLVGVEFIKENPTHWINICAAEHYQVDSFSAE